MKKNDLTSLRAKSIGEIKKVLEDKKNDAEKTRINIVSGREKDLKKAKKIRREVAQVATILREKIIIEAEKNKN